MTHRPTAVLLGSMALLALAACRRSNPPGPISPARQAAGPAVAAWFLLPVPTVQRGEELRLELGLWNGNPERLGWPNYLFEHAIARMGSEQWSLEPQAPFRIDAVGNALIALSSEPMPDHSFAPSSWSQQHLKTLLRVRDHGSGLDHAADAALPYGGITQKVGHAFELWPLVDPLALHVGDDLPLRVAFADADSQAGREITARHLESATVQRLRTDRFGSAVVRLHAAGTWWLQASHHEQAPAFGPGPIWHHASLTFELSEAR